MTFFRRLSFALTGLCFFLTTSVTAEASHARLVKRAPAFIEEWGLYNTWEAWTDMVGDFDVPGVDGVTVATFDKETGTLTWNCQKLVLGEKIAAGASIIQKATLGPEPSDGSERTVVVKRSVSEATQVLYGATLQKSIGNEKVLPIIDYVFSPGDRNWGWAIMPYVTGGSLETNFDAYPDQRSANAAFKQILNAVAAMSNAGIIHRDLKPENFLKDGDTLKLMDFDQSRRTVLAYQCDVGTPSYTAPEIIAMRTDTGSEYDTRADTFSTAMTFMALSVKEVRNADDRFQLWKDLIEPDTGLWPSAEKVAAILKSKSYAVFKDSDALLRVLSKALCKPSERYTPMEFKAAFNGVA
ncbi:hypothetical protein ACJ41O_013089 [Fusarium nematophilum]